MSYKSMTIYDAMREINARRFLLPAIQRKFVWDREQIEGLFDSILRGYPIGTFLFWKIDEEKRDEYTFYQFIQHYHERDSARNTLAPSPAVGNQTLIGILDGQQRLTSMYVALQGSYAVKRKYAKAHDDSAYPPRELYVNLLAPTPELEADNGDGDPRPATFRFLASADLKGPWPDAIWYRVRDILALQSNAEVYKEIEELRDHYPHHAGALISRGMKILPDLWDRLCREPYINYFEVDPPTLDDVVDIFIRVNSAGSHLSRTDLMFSTIVAHWELGREEIEDFLSEINSKGEGFNFNSDFVMRCCLVLTDLPVLFKVKSFKKENIELITSSWEDIRSAIGRAVDLMVRFGYSGSTLPAQTVVIPLAYFAFRNGDLRESEAALRQFVIRALLNQVFSSKTDQALTYLREDLRSLLGRSRVLTTEDVLGLRLPEGRSLRVSQQGLDELIDTSKGKGAFSILAALYGNLRFHQVNFHMDHLHPASGFTDSKLRKLGLSDADIRWWKDGRDRLPNLQLLEGIENQSKSSRSLESWVQQLPEDQRARFLLDNHIPSGTSLAFADFRQFMDARKEAMRMALARVLDVQLEGDDSSVLSGTTAPPVPVGEMSRSETNQIQREAGNKGHWDVFVSYAYDSDEARAVSVVQALENERISCWLASRDLTRTTEVMARSGISVGAGYDEAIPFAIERSQSLIILITEAAMEADRIRDELRRAVDANVPLILVRLEDVPLTPAFEYFVRDPRYSDQRAVVEGIGGLLKHLKARLPLGA